MTIEEQVIVEGENVEDGQFPTKAFRLRRKDGSVIELTNSHLMQVFEGNASDGNGDSLGLMQLYIDPSGRTSGRLRHVGVYITPEEAEKSGL